MTKTKTDNIKCVFDTIMQDKEIAAMIKNLKNNIEDLSIAISKKITYSIAQSTPVSIPAQTSSIPQREQKTGRTRTSDWSNASPKQLKIARQNRRANGRPLEPELVSALEKNFTNYNAKTDRFVRKYRIHQKQPIIPQPQRNTNTSQSQTTQSNPLIPLYSIPTNSGFFTLHFIKDSTNNRILIASRQPYEICLIDTKTKLCIIRKTHDANRTSLHIINYNTGKQITEIKSGVSLISYSAKTHDLYAKTHRDKEQHKWHISANKIVSKKLDTPCNLPQIKAAQIKKETILIDDNGNVTAYPLITLGNVGSNNTQDLMPMHQQAEQPATIITPTTNKTSDTHPAQTSNQISETPINTLQEVPVYIEHVKSNLHGSYNNIYLNGKKILSNHFGTEIKLFLSDTILGIHGIVTDNSELPQTPIWMIYDTTLNSRINRQKQKFKGYLVHAKKIQETPNGLRIDMSNRCTGTLKRDRIIKEALNKRFRIKQEKTK